MSPLQPLGAHIERCSPMSCFIINSWRKKDWTSRWIRELLWTFSAFGLTRHIVSWYKFIIIYTIISRGLRKSFQRKDIECNAIGGCSIRINSSFTMWKRSEWLNLIHWFNQHETNWWCPWEISERSVEFALRFPRFPFSAMNFKMFICSEKD